MAVGVVALWNMQHIDKEHRFIVADRLALYAPLIIMCGRVGCFFTGCCYGIETDLPWKICYAHPDVEAPLDVFIHPVQLYSVLLLGVLFVLLYCMQHKLQKGQLVLLSLQGIFLERFVMDFFRDDRTLALGSLSLHQVIAVLGILTLIVGYLYKKRDKIY
jgi:phosphatidylglycerol:prolipoprotein diacylglycerol transferase